MTEYKASPGTAVIEPLSSSTDGDLSAPQVKNKHMGIGKIISMGNDVTIEGGAILKASDYGKVGDIIMFLSYYEEGGYDFLEFGGKKLYFVRWQDFRGMRNDA